MLMQLQRVSYQISNWWEVQQTGTPLKKKKGGRKESFLDFFALSDPKKDNYITEKI